MDRQAAEDAAEWLFKARRGALAVENPPPARRPATTAEAYDVQDALHRKQLRDGRGRLAGWKIGCTNKVLQDLLNIPYPAAGGILAENVHRSGASLAFGQFTRVGVECEIAFELGEDLSAGGAPWTRTRVAQRVAACMAAIEIVDNRYGDFRATGAPLLIADDFFQAAVVLGERRTDWQGIDLVNLSAATRIDGREVGRGRGADVMGHPLEPLAWLANARAERGQGLHRGDIVLTGSMVAVHWPPAPCAVVIENSALGPVSVNFHTG